MQRRDGSSQLKRGYLFGGNQLKELNGQDTVGSCDEYIAIEFLTIVNHPSRHSDSENQPAKLGEPAEI